MINFEELVFDKRHQDTGVVLDNLDEVFATFDDEATQTALLATATFLIAKESIRSFIGKAKDRDGNDLKLAFFVYQNHAFFMGMEHTGSSYLKAIPFTKEDLKDYVFTPTMYDLENVSILNTEDVIAKAK